MEALTPASETSRRTEVMALPAALRPATGAGVPLSTLAAQVGAVPAEGSSTSDLPITGVTLRAQDVQPGDLFAALLQEKLGQLAEHVPIHSDDLPLL